MVRYGRDPVNMDPKGGAVDDEPVVKGADGEPLKPFQFATEYLGVAESTLRNWLTYGTGPRSYRIGRHRMFRRSDLDEFIQERATERAS